MQPSTHSQAFKHVHGSHKIVQQSLAMGGLHMEILLITPSAQAIAAR